MHEPTASKWAGRVLRPTKDFQPISWGAGFHSNGHGDAFGIVIDPPRFAAVTRMRIWKGAAGLDFEVPSQLIWEGHFEFGDLLGNRPHHLPTMIWFPIPKLAEGFYLAEVSMLDNGQVVPFGVGIYDAPSWTWQAGFMTMLTGQVRPAKSPFGLAWDVGQPPREPELTSEVCGISIPKPRYARYDLICTDDDGGFHLFLGKDRKLDPEEFEANAPQGMEEIFALFSTPAGSEVIPVHEWRSGVKRGHEAEHSAWLKECQSRLPRLMSKIGSQQAVTLAGYGDSITSLGSRSPDQINQANGSRRDTLRHFEAYGDDWRSQIPLFGGHHRLGWNWFLKEAIERASGAPCLYQNWGLAGTTSGTGYQVIDGSDYPNAANPTRVEKMLCDNPDLVVVCVGMNDIGDPIDTKANLVQIINHIQSHGAEALIVAPPRQNPNFHSRDDLLWRYTHQRVTEAAEQSAVALVPMDKLYGETGAMGLSRQSHCAASFTNHPGRRELAAIGRLIAQIIPDAM